MKKIIITTILLILIPVGVVSADITISGEIGAKTLEQSLTELVESLKHLVASLQSRYN